MWAPAAHMSKNAPDVEENPSWVAKGPYGAAASAYWSLAGFDLNDTEARRYLLSELVERRTKDGLEGVWLDTMHTHGFAQYDYSNPVVTPQVEAMIGRIRDLQRAGFNVYSEGRGPFAISGSGYSESRLQYYQGHEHRAYGTSMNFNFSPRTEAGGEFRIDFYRFAANKALPYNSWGENARKIWDQILADGTLQAEVRHANHDYNAVVEHMGKRRLLHGDHGVEWTSHNPADRTTVLFAYDAFNYQLPDAGMRVVDVTTGETVRADGQTLDTEARHTYLVTLP